MTAQRHPEMPDLQKEADKLQRRATRPEDPVWVGASAGSGKTRVLVERMLRLMLPSPGREASPPHKILCITFTKAGASEVMERVIKYLREWAIADEAALQEGLTKLLEQPASEDQLKAARALFARVIEAPGGMKIMTIHAFCQSVLARFPMEAGLPAGFEVMMETESKDLLRETRRLIITRLQLNAPEDRKLKGAFDLLSAIRNADQLEDLMESMMAERSRLRDLITRYGDIDALEAGIYKSLNVAPGTTRDALLFTFLRDLPESELKTLCERLDGDNKTNQGKSDCIRSLMAAADKDPYFEEYWSAFLNQDGDIKKRSGRLKDDAQLISIYESEGLRLQQLNADLCNLATAEATAALLRFSAAALEGYEGEKHKKNRLDFEDLIDRTKRLLGGDGVNWVQYKLDGGIDHILVDEAQDTNPDQWDIISALYDEFYAGTGMREPTTRTTFVVGDEKQSIFSFQRADPRVFWRQHERLKVRTENADMKLQTIPMQISFRSSPSILQMVDAVFATPEMRDGVLQQSDAVMHHDARQTGKAGRVELWPLIARADAPAREAWALPLKVEAAENPVAQMADQLARKIRALLDNPGEMLESKGRRIRPGDIMILLSKRQPLAESVLKALREHNVPVSGIDRMVVTRQLAVRDALAAIAFTLQPDDDLNLACLLKSPFIGFSEQQLFDVAHGRGNRALWPAVKDKGGPVAEWLSQLLAREGLSSGAYLHALLYGPCPADSRSGFRAILKRLGPDMRDPLQELLARADTHDIKSRGALQEFLQDALNDDSEIKRDLGEAGNVVRLMTVHGSKGLEAPIVFLPDTMRSTTRGGGSDSVLWPDRADKNAVPLWAASSDTAAPAYDARKAAAHAREDEEYRRLLYVALTRAADRLYIGGVQKAKSVNQKSWYFACEAAIKTVGREEDGTYVLENRQTDPVHDDKKEEKKAQEKITLPAWALEPAPDAGTPPRPLMPSRPDQDDPSVMSPLFGDISHRFKRGRLIHTLFQFLPDLPEDERLPRAALWLASPAHDISVAVQNEILEATFNVLNDPAFAHIFSPLARAEVPLTGHLKTAAGTHTIVSGQVDRLLVEDSTITVLDYKTNRPAPKTIEDVPLAYKKQLRTYRDILAEIWPGRTIRTALIWTDGPALMDLTDAL